MDELVERCAARTSERFGRSDHLRRWWRFGRAGRKVANVLRGADVSNRFELRPGVVFMHGGLGAVVNANAVVEGPAIIFHRVTLGNAWDGTKGAPRVAPFVFVGTGATIIGPVTVGPFAAVAAGAVVARDVPPLHIAAGVPATLRPLPTEDLCRWFELSEAEITDWLATSTPPPSGANK